MTTTTRNIFLLATGIGSIIFGLTFSLVTTGNLHPQISFGTVLAGLLCLQGSQLLAHRASPGTTLQATLLMLGAIGACISATGLIGGYSLLLQGISVLLSTLGVCAGLFSTRLASLSVRTRGPGNTAARHNENRQQGTIKWFNSSKGFGFISRNGQSDVFVHFRSLRDPQVRSLNEGERVEFIAIPNDKGVQAEDVVLLDARAE